MGEGGSADSAVAQTLTIDGSGRSRYQVPGARAISDPISKNVGIGSYSRPSAAMTFASLRKRAGAPEIGAEHAPFAHKYTAGLSRSGNIDSPHGGGPSRLPRDPIWRGRADRPERQHRGDEDPGSHWTRKSVHPDLWMQCLNEITFEPASRQIPGGCGLPDCPDRAEVRSGTGPPTLPNAP